jgi:hypothetical protein
MRFELSGHQIQAVTSLLQSVDAGTGDRRSRVRNSTEAFQSWHYLALVTVQWRIQPVIGSSGP